MSTNALAQLKDIHLPSPISFWALAPGWYVVFVIFIAAALFLASIFYQRWLQKIRRQQILLQIDTLYTQYQDSQQNTALSQLSVLLRRVALDKFPRQTIASLQGESWLKFLDQHYAKSPQAFTHGCGKILISAPYQAEIIDDAGAVFALVKDWVAINV